jgi:uncharacterized membrane protein
MPTVFLLCLLIGVACGLRAFTPPAVVCWAAHLGWLNLAGSPLTIARVMHVAELADPIAVGVFTFLALSELFGDKTAKIGPRTAPLPFGLRIFTGFLSALALSIAGHAALALGIIAGVVGAIAGTLTGFRIRRALTAPGKLPDLPVALIEDVIAIGGSLLLVSRF